MKRERARERERKKKEVKIDDNLDNLNERNRMR